MKRTIYGQRCQLAAECFTRAGGPGKMLIVPIDLAKSEHVAAFCLGTGEYVTKSFVVHNTPAGIEYLLGRVAGICRQRGIAHNNVLIGAEDPAEYAFNFVHGIRLHNYPFLRVNAAEAATLRNNSRAVSDKLALDGIAQALIRQRGRSMEHFDEIYSALKSAARSRRRLVTLETAWKNRIHRSVEILFPSFLNESESSLAPFLGASLGLMSADFSSIRIRRMRPETLAKRLHRHGAQKPQETALRLKALAERVLAPAPALIPYESASLATKVQILQSVRAGIAMETNQMARCLAQTPGFVITSIPGIGVVLAAHIMAEYGCPDGWPEADCMASYAGIVPRLKQSGGPSKPAVVGHLPIDANRILKDYLLQSSYHTGTTGSHRLRDHYQRVQNRDGRERLSTAKLLVRIIRKMVKSESVYLPAELLHPGRELPRGYLAGIYSETARTLDRKWKGYDLSGINPEMNLLLKWKEAVNEITKLNYQQ